jgi:thiosulfate reductase cytochrome b subunit
LERTAREGRRMSDVPARPTDSDPPDRPRADGRVDTWRHPGWVRLTHWINAAAVIVLLMSGLNILMAHPALYWGVRSTFADPWLQIPTPPDWLMLPPVRDLARARNWHFLFAWIFVFNGLLYVALGLVLRRFGRRLWPTGADLKGFGASVAEHARLHFPTDERARFYNVIQKLTYLVMVLVMLPMMLITGLSMSPGFNAIGGVLLEVMGGRQSARTLHFLSAGLVVGFIVIHVGLVLWTGPANNLRSMLTGWYAIRPSGQRDGGGAA